MPRRLLYTEHAVTDLDGIAHWLTQPGAGHGARRKLTRIWGAIERLRNNPCLYRIGGYEGVREMPCSGGYHVLYRLQPDTGSNDTAGDVQILRVLGPGQDHTFTDPFFDLP